MQNRRPVLSNTLAAAALLAGMLVISGAPAQAQGRVLYPDPSVASQEIHDALAKARAGHKRVILDFGGNWCGDCKVLDIYLHEPENQTLLEANYELVDVNIGHMDANQEIAEKYGIPLKRGVPALAVLAPDGKVLMAQSHGEFESMRRLQSSDVTKFLNDWKPAARASHGTR